MKVFKFKSDNYHYAVSGNNENEAKEALLEYTWDDLEIDEVEEVPESEWDKKFIQMKNPDTEDEVFNVSIRDLMEPDLPTFLYSNDPDLAE